MPITNIHDVKDIATICASIIAIYVALAGLKAWRKQLKGKTEYELARRYLIALFKLRDALFDARSPLKTLGEISSEKNPATFKDFFIERWGIVQEAMSALNIEVCEAEATWGYEAKQITEPLMFTCNKVYIAFLMQEEDKMQDKDHTIIGRIDGKDATSQQIVIETIKIEKFLSKYLK